MRSVSLKNTLSLRLASFSSLFSFSLVVQGCGELPGFTVASKSDDFIQTPVLNDKIDILFVVDNSGSMAQEQQNLADSFETFIDKFSSKNLNFQVGVISTDVFANADYWAATGAYAVSSPYKNMPNNGPGSLLSKQGNDRIIRPTSINFIEQFKENVLLGTTGSGIEAGILSMIKAFDPAMLAAGGWNEGFIRNEAFLAVIFVSDEGESRAKSPAASSYLRGYPSEYDARIEEFTLTLDSLKPARRDLIRVEAIVARSVSECPTVGETSGVRGIGVEYIRAAEVFGDTTPSNICADFSSDLESLGADLVTILTKFKLVQKPLGQIVVTVDGVVVPRDSVNGWEYFAETQEVEFRGSFIPKANSKISVTYVPGAPLE